MKGLEIRVCLFSTILLIFVCLFVCFFNSMTKMQAHLGQLVSSVYIFFLRSKMREEKIITFNIVEITPIL